MGIEGSRVAVVGGSIAGCAAAIALRRAGCEVTVYERSSGALNDRGFGIAMPVPLFEELVAAGYLEASTPVLRCTRRTWVVRDEDACPRRGRVVWHQPFCALLNNWGVLWRALRSRIPDETYLEGAKVTEVEPGNDGTSIVVNGGVPQRFDLVVGADGYRSTLRRFVDAGSRLGYAGYGLWRGAYPEQRLDGQVRAELDREIVWIGFSGGHAGCYLIPDFKGGGHRLNWALYSAMPASLSGEDHRSIRPGSVDDESMGFFTELLARDLPQHWADLIRETTREELFVQPVYDATMSSYVAERLLLIGDAGTVARPHTAAGATKALADALALERVCQDGSSWDGVLAAYDRQRLPAGNELVALGRRLGRSQVEQTPHWPSMTPEEFAEWVGVSGIVPYPYG